MREAWLALDLASCSCLKFLGPVRMPTGVGDLEQNEFIWERAVLEGKGTTGKQVWRETGAQIAGPVPKVTTTSCCVP